MGFALPHLLSGYASKCSANPNATTEPAVHDFVAIYLQTMSLATVIDIIAVHLSAQN